MISQLSQTILCDLFVAITMSAILSTQSLVMDFYISNQKVITRVKFQPISYSHIYPKFNLADRTKYYFNDQFDLVDKLSNTPKVEGILI